DVIVAHCSRWSGGDVQGVKSSLKGDCLTSHV
ncbi:MAG: hypothetical protein ACI9SB_001457, partial [Candidatus Azotimanducaceae bacterium]